MDPQIASWLLTLVKFAIWGTALALVLRVTLGTDRLT